MKLIGQYLWTHRMSAVVFTTLTAAYGFLLYLFHVPVIVWCYSTAVGVFLAVLIGAMDFRRYERRHRALCHLRSEVIDSIDHLPEPRDLIEEDYQEVIHASFKARQELTFIADKRYQEMMAYYTLWVHQIKTPIAAARLLLQTGDIPEAQQGELSDELSRIEQYVDMVLCYLRLENVSTDYVLRACDLDQLIRQAVRRFAPQFIRVGCRLNYTPVQCSVLTDEKWLLFVIEQLLSNALKYTGKGQISIRLIAPKTLVIADSGMGIAPEDLPRIFEAGFTGENGRTDKKATGLGLYLCRRICDNLGHRISAESTLGKGTKIYLNLQSDHLEVE